MVTQKADPELKGTDAELTKYTLDSLEKNPKGITDYPILTFDQDALERLYVGIRETLRQSNVKPRGGLGYRFLKRTIDIAGAAGGLLVLALPMGIVAIKIYQQDHGSPIFSQIRLTQNGKPFRMYKFRSMCLDAEERFAEVQAKNETDGLAFKSEDDPRVTEFGKFIRRTSLDELPQLWNVLKGDMSLIGPRPCLPREAVLYTPHHMDRLLVKAGLACESQVHGRSELEFEKSINYDIQYIETRSIPKDIALIFRVLFAVIRKKGAK